MRPGIPQKVVLRNGSVCANFFSFILYSFLPPPLIRVRIEKKKKLLPALPHHHVSHHAPRGTQIIFKRGHFGINKHSTFPRALYQ